ncbi:hypothetical protein GGR70_001604 [Xanthomonas campestris]|uniref:hypothetical protein n=1 Tax=Xanthomonas campestris TaxID=339 RepID=UPI00216A5839|nr:hypothetical protein [Xanthomonas campestris]MCS3846618.1 hypothetical protein [Xanthomonas campestris]
MRASTVFVFVEGHRVRRACHNGAASSALSLERSAGALLAHARVAEVAAEFRQAG